MPDEYIDPVDHVEASHPIAGRGAERPPRPAHRGSVTGTIVSVHRKTAHHAEDHTLDTSVGSHAQSEVVIQVDEGDVEDLVGRRVVIHYREE